MKPRLLIVTSTFPRWKDDTDPPFVYELARRLTGYFDITVHTPHYSQAATRESLEGLRIHRFRYFFSSMEKLAGATGILPSIQRNKLYYAMVPFFLVAQFFSLLFLVRRIRPDIIHAHWIIPQGFFAVLLQFLCRVPVVVTAHGADVFGLQGAMFRVMKRFTLSNAMAVTVVSRALAESIKMFVSPAISVGIIPMGVNSRVFTPVRKNEGIKEKYNIDGTFLLYVGRLTEKKGVRYLIDAMPRVLQNIPTAKLLIIGSGELERELKCRVVDLNLSNSILFVGGVSNKDLPGYYASADLFVGPSIEAANGDTEGFGLTLVEAAMSECLIVASNVGGIGDIIVDEETGFLVEAKNSQLLAEKICFVIENKNIFKKVGQKSRQLSIQRFDWQVISREYMRIFDQLTINDKYA